MTEAITNQFTAPLLTKKKDVEKIYKSDQQRYDEVLIKINIGYLESLHIY